MAQIIADIQALRHGERVLTPRAATRKPRPKVSASAKPSAVPTPKTPEKPAAEPKPIELKGYDLPAWESLRKQALVCTRCQELADTRTQVVFGTGNPDQPLLMVIGEAPGADEDRKGEPFVGRAGQLMDTMFLTAGVRRDEIYIANVLKCRPPGNRNPKPEEISNCDGYLRQQIALIAPKILVTLGNFATQYILQTKTGITRLRGKTHQVGQIAVLPTMHPSALLRNPQWKLGVWEDMRLLAKLVNRVPGR